MVRLGCAGSIHGRLSIEEASSFFEKVQLHFQLADLLAAIAENIRQTGQSLFLPASNLRWMDTEHLRDLGRRLVRLDGLHSHFGLQVGRVILSSLRHCSPYFSMPLST